MKLFGKRVRRHARPPHIVEDIMASFTQNEDGIWCEDVEEDQDVRLVVARALRYAAQQLEAEPT